jgi:hypothetical protein
VIKACVIKFKIPLQPFPFHLDPLNVKGTQPKPWGMSSWQYSTREDTDHPLLLVFKVCRNLMRVEIPLCRIESKDKTSAHIFYLT